LEEKKSGERGGEEGGIREALCSSAATFFRTLEFLNIVLPQEKEDEKGEGERNRNQRYSPSSLTPSLLRVARPAHQAREWSTEKEKLKGKRGGKKRGGGVPRAGEPVYHPSLFEELD